MSLLISNLCNLIQAKSSEQWYQTFYFYPSGTHNQWAGLNETGLIRSHRALWLQNALVTRAVNGLLVNSGHWGISASCHHKSERHDPDSLKEASDLLEMNSRNAPSHLLWAPVWPHHTSLWKTGKALKGGKHLLLSSVYSVIHHHTLTTDWTLSRETETACLLIIVFAFFFSKYTFKIKIKVPNWCFSP